MTELDLSNQLTEPLDFRPWLARFFKNLAISTCAYVPINTLFFYGLLNCTQIFYELLNGFGLLELHGL